MVNPHRASDCIYHLQVFLKSLLGFRNFRASHTQWVCLWVLERMVNYFLCMCINMPKSIGVSAGIGVLYIDYFRALPIEKYISTVCIVL